MSVHEIQSDTEFEKVIKEGVALIDFNAPWCAPCRSQEPIVKELADMFAGKAAIAAMNIDGRHQLAGALGIQSIPTLILFKDNKEVKRFVGLHSKNILFEAITKALQ